MPKSERNPKPGDRGLPSGFGVRASFGFRHSDFGFRPPDLSTRQEASVLIIVLWISFGLVSLALYFAGSMLFEMRASENRVSALEADAAIDGAARYMTSVLGISGTNGSVPDPVTYSNAAVAVGESHFWLIGRDTNSIVGAGRLTFAMVDEASKLNLNTATSNQLVWLPRITQDLTSGILDWRGTNGPTTTEAYYETLQPAYQCKNAYFETVDELRLVYGATMDILVGEDANRNGILDPNENDENQNGLLDAGLTEYVTVCSREPNTNSSGSPWVNISSLSGTSSGKLNSLLQTNFGSTRAAAIMRSLGLQSSGANTNSGGGRGGPPAPGPTIRFASPLQFYVRSGMTASEFARISTNLTVSTNTYIQGRVNINTASAPVLSCLLGGDLSAAQQAVNYRQANPTALSSIAWIKDALGDNYSSDLAALQAGDYITTQSYQFSADVAALGPHGRGYRRVRFIFDTSGGTPQIIYRQDLSQLGWAMGTELRQKWMLANASR